MTTERKAYEELEDWESTVADVGITHSPEAGLTYEEIKKQYRKEIIDEVVKRLEQRTTVIMQDDDGVIYKKYN